MPSSLKKKKSSKPSPFELCVIIMLDEAYFEPFCFSDFQHSNRDQFDLPVRNNFKNYNLLLDCVLVGIYTYP